MTDYESAYMDGYKAGLKFNQDHMKKLLDDVAKISNRGTNMFLVMMHCFAENTDLPCIITETRDKAINWIEEEMKGKVYSGGYHQIHEIEFYK